MPVEPEPPDQTTGAVSLRGTIVVVADAHPLIQFLDGPSGRRASLIGHGLDVWEVIATIRDNDGSVAEASEYLHVPAGLVEAAVAYYGEYQDEIDQEIKLNEAEYERGRASAEARERALRG